MIDMKMPKCCIGCPILRESAWWGTYCPFVCEENNVNIKERTDRPSECPLKEIEKSEDCVSRQAALDALCEMLHGCFGVDDEELDAVITTINELPPVTPVEKIGHWEWDSDFWCRRCSECHLSKDSKYFNYCPNCGAKMQEVEDD